jgi:hypothetical protein
LGNSYNDTFFLPPVLCWMASVSGTMRIIDAKATPNIQCNSNTNFDYCLTLFIQF